jgi:hypothetical protein
MLIVCLARKLWVEIVRRDWSDERIEAELADEREQRAKVSLLRVNSNQLDVSTAEDIRARMGPLNPLRRCCYRTDNDGSHRRQAAVFCHRIVS